MFVRDCVKFIMLNWESVIMDMCKNVMFDCG